MKILHVMTRFLTGGAEEKTLLELEHLRGDHEYTLATGPEVDARSVERALAAGTPHVVLPSLRHYSPWRAPLALREARRLIRRGGYDVVHTHSTEAGIIAREAARRERVRRVVHTIHGREFSEAHPFLIRQAVVTLHRRLAPATVRYFSNAQALTRAYLDKGIGKPTQYALVRSAVDLNRVRRARAIHLEGDPVLLTAGRLVADKGLEEIVDAIGRIAPRWPGLRLYVAGEGPLEHPLRTRASRLGVADQVRFLGHRGDLPGLLRGADAFVFASYREGTPRVITEALALGCPIVATWVDGIPEQVDGGRAALLVPPRDSAALATAVERTLKNSDATKDRVRSGLRAAAAFSLPRMLRALRLEYACLEEGEGTKAPTASAG